jgi:hypothetical protein
MYLTNTFLLKSVLWIHTQMDQISSMDDPESRKN